MSQALLDGLRGRAVPGKGFGTNGSYQVRVHGEAVETAAPYDSGRGEDTPWVPQVIGSAHVDDAGEVSIDCHSIEAASRDALAVDHRRLLRDLGLVRPETGRRYLTRRYATLDRAEAERLAAIDGTPVTAIVVADAEPVAASGSWAWWSDGRLTTAIGLPRWTERLDGLSADARKLIGLAYGSDSGCPSVGWSALASVAEIVSTNTIETGPPTGVYARAKVETMTVRLTDGTVVKWLVNSSGHYEGYAYEIKPEATP